MENLAGTNVPLLLDGVPIFLSTLNLGIGGQEGSAGLLQPGTQQFCWLILQNKRIDDLFMKFEYFFALIFT